MPKKGGAWTVCRFNGGLGKKDGWGVFEGDRGGGGDTPMHTMNLWEQSNEKVLQLTEQHVVPQNYKSCKITRRGCM